MNSFGPITDRIRWTYQLIRDRVIRTDAERALIITESRKRNEAVVPIIRRARTTYDLCERMTLRVEDFDLLVANKAKNFLGSSVHPEWAGEDWIPAMVERGAWTLQKDGLYHNPATDVLKLTISPADAEALIAIRDYWKTRTITSTADSWQPDGYDELCRLNVCTNMPGMPLMQMSAGHLTPGFAKIINVGYAAIRRQAEDWLEAHRNDLMGENMNRCLFYTAAKIMCDAASMLARRYGMLCSEKAGQCESGNPRRKAELFRMSDGLMWISENPARTFWEACQAAMLYQLFLSLDKIPVGSWGRFDQYTWPFLKADLYADRITMDEAQELIDAFFLKSNQFYGAMHPMIAEIIGIGNTYLHTTIGGIDPDTGKDASNPVTYMVLATMGRLGLHDPTISLRVHENTPDELWQCAIETTRCVGGLPLFQNDDIIVPGMMRELGFDLHDARDYAIIGCQEITGSGNDYPASNGISPPHACIHYGVVMGMAINNGINPFNGEQCSIKTGYLYDMQTFDDVKAAVKSLARYLTRAQVSINHYTEYLTMYHSPLTGLSISMEGCMESGKDCTWGGCKYNSYGGTASGLATIADSLTAIRYMIFDNKLCSTHELYDAVMSNWDGYEPLRQRILNEVPHYGNADPYADEQMKWICDTYYEICGECYSARTRIFKAGLYSAADHVNQGYHTWATPDGRKTGEPLADAASPAQGRDRNGPTAVVTSAHCYDHSKFMDGLALNLRFHPSALKREDGAAKLRDLTRTYMNCGGMEIQYNVVDSDTMRAAQTDPDLYRNLVVRIAGYSAYFIELTRDCQNDLINRTENGA